MKDNMDNSTNQRESNPEFSGQHRSQIKDAEPHFTLHHNNSETDIIAAHQLQHINDNSYGNGFTNNDDRKNVPPYNADSKITNKTVEKENCDDLESTDSNIFSSLHESHNSRKSLTKI